jgi:hypothetical protein
MDGMSIWMALLWGLLMLVFAVPGYLIQSSMKKALERQRRARDWPMTDGVVSGGHVEQNYRMGHRRNLFGFRQRVVVYRPVIEYTYQVDGQTYQGSRYKNSYPGEWAHPDQTRVQALVEEYFEGKPVQVHYLPEDPGQAYLELETDEGGLQAARWFGFTLLAAGALVLAYGIFSLAQNIGASAGRAVVVKSPAVLPAATSHITDQLEKTLNLACKQESFGGVNIAYRGWRCTPPAGGEFPSVDVWSRRDEPEKADLVWLTTDRSDSDKDQAQMLTVIQIALQSDDAAAGKKVYQEAVSQKSRVESTLGEVPLVVDASSETRFNMMVGESK